MKRLLLVLAACSKGDPPPPAQISFGALCDVKPDQMVRLDGYVTVGERVLCDDSGCWLQLWPKTEYSNPKDAVLVHFLQGDSANHMAYLPSPYLASSLKLYPENGTVLHHGDRVRLFGTRGTHKDVPCFLDVSHIQGLGMSPTDRANPTSDK